MRLGERSCPEVGWLYPKKCFMHAAARRGSPSSESPLPHSCDAWMPFTSASPILEVRKGSSPKVSNTRGHSGCVASPRIGANSQGTAAARLSLAATRPASRASAGLKVAARLICCGKSTAP